MTPDGPWTFLKWRITGNASVDTGIGRVLEDSRKQASPPVQTFLLKQDTNARYLKFVLRQYYGNGGGLQYFKPIFAGKSTHISKEGPGLYDARRVLGCSYSLEEFRMSTVEDIPEAKHGQMCTKNLTFLRLRAKHLRY
jgi:hypothetical protein